MRFAAPFVLFVLLTALGQSHAAPPEITPRNDAIPAARDIEYPGTMSLSVDASDIGQGIFRIKQRIPVAQPGRLVLLYPKWLPGNHAPNGRISKVAGLRISANGRALARVRDTIDVYAFHVDVPEGAKAIDVEFQYVSPTAENQGRILMTPDMASIQWIATSLYPAGYYVRNIKVQPSLTVPQGWKAATALRPIAGAGTRTIAYETVSYDVLADSPAIAGAHFRRIPLTQDVAIAIAADSAAELAATDAQIALHRNLVTQSLKLFGAQHYDRYEFLLTISANLGDIGLEHHRSSENGVEPGYFTDWDNALPDRNLLPHEFAHSWNGKYRRGRDLWTPDYRAPMENSLLWVYEGQTQFWGYVLGARSGLLSKEETLGALALIAATYDDTPGRAWRPLIDTTNDPIIAQRAPQPWRNWQRSEDYYNEGLLIWADVDRIIRQQSGGRRSMDDFARAFFGMNDRDYGELTYDFEEVVATLNRVQPYDWDGYLKRRVDRIAEQAPLEGLTQGGYRLVYSDKPTAWISAVEKIRKISNFSFSGGFVVDKDGKISAVSWDSAAFDAGMAVGSQLLAVNGRSYNAERMKSAIKEAQGSREPIKLLVKNGDAYRMLDFQWHGGLRYPRLEKTGKGAGTLDALLAPR
ncbi:MAG TPA: peptidase M61 [Allosphingosinicella sp.]|nr:peptidase M61 [Allosphingosinicella sp.]